jgi:hypothetical protein
MAASSKRIWSFLRASRSGALAPVLLFATLAACSSPPEVQACENYIKGIVDAPSTYRRASVSSVATTENGKPIQSVLITYDASNAFGVPMRDMKVCTFAIVDGKIETNGQENGDSSEVTRVTHQLDAATGRTSGGCCR